MWLLLYAIPYAKSQSVCLLHLFLPPLKVQAVERPIAAVLVRLPWRAASDTGMLPIDVPLDFSSAITLHMFIVGMLQPCLVPSYTVALT
jgi:hypothetical protein